MNLFKTMRRFYLPMFLAYVVASTALVLVARLFRDPESTTFWTNIAWAELLLFVLWLPFMVLSHPSSGDGKEFSSRQTAILPALTGLVIGYVVVAGGLFVTDLFFRDLGSYGTAAQLIVGALTLIAGLGMQTAMAHAEAGEERFGTGAGRAVSPEDLAVRLRAASARLTGVPGAKPLIQAYETLREDLTHRLPTTGAITKNDAYAALSARLSAELAAPPPAGPDEAEARAADMAALRAEIGIVAGQLRK